MNIRNERNRLSKMIGENDNTLERRNKMKFSSFFSNHRWLSRDVKIFIFLVIFMSLNFSQVFAARFNRMTIAQLQTMTTRQLKTRLNILHEQFEHCNQARNYYERPWHVWKEADRRRIKYNAVMKSCYEWWKKNKPKYDQLEAERTKLINKYNRNRSRALYKEIMPQLKDVKQQMAKLLQVLERKRATYLKARELREKYKALAAKAKERYLRFKHRIGKWQSYSEKVVIEIEKCQAELSRRASS